MTPARTRTLAIVGGAAVAAVLLVVLLMPKKHAAAPQPVVATSPAPEAPAPVAAPAPEPAKSDVKTVTIRFEADPPGAHVLDEKDGKDLGAVPLEVQLPKGGEASKYKLRLAGYREVPVTATPTADRTMHVVLEKVPAATTAADAHHRPAHHAKRKSVIDEDGLAMPSF
jgi:hypothetical protein